MAAQLATAATHGGAISRAISGGKFFIGGRSNSSSGASHVALDKLSATKVLRSRLLAIGSRRPLQDIGYRPRYCPPRPLRLMVWA